MFRVPTEEGWFDRHFHDCHEYWLVYGGKAKVLSEGIEYYVKPGDIVCTEAGEEHDILEVYEDLEAFWFEDATPPGSRTGHLHRDPGLAQGHPVPCKPLPEDFPE
jgi:mannose-6-phosphate isomerase-like protein (cupin superfamily)